MDFNKINVHTLVTASEETTYPIEESTSPQDLTTIPGVVESTSKQNDNMKIWMEQSEY